MKMRHTMLLAVLCILFSSNVVNGQDSEEYCPPQGPWSDINCGKSVYTKTSEGGPAGSREPLPAPKIQGGIDARDCEYPWQVQFSPNSDNPRELCGGVIISPCWMITAGHCVKKKRRKWRKMGVYAGSNDVQETDTERIGVTKVVRHPDYKKVKGRNNGRNVAVNDIALVQICPPVQFNDCIRPPCPPKEDEDYTWQKCIVTGWGATDKNATVFPERLQAVALNITSLEYAKKQWGRRVGKQLGETHVTATDNVGDTQRDAHVGDSGGPLTVEDNNGCFALVGIVSYGSTADGFPGIYMRISSYLDWIQKTIGTDKCPKEC